MEKHMVYIFTWQSMEDTYSQWPMYEIYVWWTALNGYAVRNARTWCYSGLYGSRDLAFKSWFYHSQAFFVKALISLFFLPSFRHLVQPRALLSLFLSFMTLEATISYLYQRNTFIQLVIKIIISLLCLWQHIRKEE